MVNQEKLVALGTQNKDKEETHNTICVGNHYSQINTNNIRQVTILNQSFSEQRQIYKRNHACLIHVEYIAIAFSIDNMYCLRMKGRFISSYY
jgi:hypothetical protein